MKEYLQKYQLYSISDTLMQMHYPASLDHLYHAKHRIAFDELLYLSLQLKLRNSHQHNSKYVVKNTNKTIQFIKNIGFELTKDQNNVCESLIEKAKTGNRIDSLIQGDVSCGKTIVAFILMMVMAECLDY